MSRSRIARGIVGSRARYAEAAERLEAALAEWRAASVPITVTRDGIPPWSPHQLAATERAAMALANLVRRRREWESAVREIGYPR